MVGAAKLLGPSRISAADHHWWVLCAVETCDALASFTRAGFPNPILGTRGPAPFDLQAARMKVTAERAQAGVPRRVGGSAVQCSSGSEGPKEGRRSGRTSVYCALPVRCAVRIQVVGFSSSYKASCPKLGSRCLRY